MKYSPKYVHHLHVDVEKYGGVVKIGLKYLIVHACAQVLYDPLLCSICYTPYALTLIHFGETLTHVCMHTRSQASSHARAYILQQLSNRFSLS